MPAGTLPRRASAPRLASKRLLARASDERLVEQMRRGSEPAFEVAFERHGAAILGFCRHMLGSTEEAEDAVQHSFAAAWRDLSRGGSRSLTLKPWLFAIARNRCISLLRSRREGQELPELATVGLSEQVERRAELHELLRDIAELPFRQREALLLSETGDLSHAEIAGVLGCEVASVKALVFRARSTLIARREARSVPCEEIREQLAILRGGALRRTELQLHLRECPGCRVYRDDVKRQRELLAAAVPVVPAALKANVLAAAGIGGGAAAGGASAGGAAVGAAAAGGVGATVSTAGSALFAKLAVVGVLAGGSVVAGTALVDELPGVHGGPSAVEREAPAPARGGQSTAPVVPARAPDAARRERARTNRSAGDARGPRAASEATSAAPTGTGHGRKLGHEKRAVRGKSLLPGRVKMRDQAKKGEAKAQKARGRGPIDAPPASVPVRRGPPEPKPTKEKAPTEKAAKQKPAKQKPAQQTGPPVPKAAPAPKAAPPPKPAPAPTPKVVEKPKQVAPPKAPPVAPAPPGPPPEKAAGKENHKPS